MSNKVYNWVKKLDLPRGEKTTLLVLANSFNDKKGYSWPTNKMLAEWCSCTDRTIREHIKSLICKNVIQKEDVRDHLGRRVTHKYMFNIDQSLDNLPEENACGQLIRLPEENNIPTGSFCKPTGNNFRKDYIINKNKTKIKQNDFSLVDENEQAKLEILIGVKFEELSKIYDYDYDIQRAQRLHKQLCLENKQTLRFAENLITVAKHQKVDRRKFEKAGKFIPAQCTLTNWLKDKHWLNVIKSTGDKKKTSPYLRCSCGEEYLRGSFCNRCAELKRRVVYG